MLTHVGFMLVMLALCWLMLALCWLMLDQVGSSWLMSAQVGPSWPQDASMLAHKFQKITGTHLPRPPRGQLSSIFDRKLLILEHPGSWKYWKKHLFYRSVCNLHFFVSLNAFWVSKLAQVRSKLAHVGLLEQIWGQVEPSWHQVGSRCANFVPSWPPKKSVSRWRKNQLTPSWPQICTWRAQVCPKDVPVGPGGSPTRCWEGPGNPPGGIGSQEFQNCFQKLPKVPKIDPKKDPFWYQIHTKWFPWADI